MTMALSAAAQASVVAVPTSPRTVSAAPAKAEALPSWCLTGKIPGVEISCDLSAAVPSGTSQFTVTLRQGGELVWAGTLSTASYEGASINQSKNETFACLAYPPQTRQSQQLSTSFSIRIGGYQDGLRVPITVEVTRPFDPTEPSPPSCQGSLGTRTVRFETRAEVLPGKPVTIAGDAGLAITILRR